MGRWDKLKSVFKGEPEGVRYYLQERRGNEMNSVVSFDELASKDECVGYFQPGAMYQLMRQDVETGKWAGVAWKHFEPDLRPKELLEKPKKKLKKPVPTPAAVMAQYASDLRNMLEPLSELNEVFKTLQSFGGSPPAEGGEGGMGGVPPLDFKGGAPWYLHPYIVTYVGRMISDVSDHFFDRLDKSLGRTEEKEEEGEVPPPPSIEEYEEEEEEEEEEMTPPPELPEEEDEDKEEDEA